MQIGGEIILETDEATGEKRIRLNQRGPNRSGSFSLMQFFNDMSSHVIDTYLIALIALDGIIQGNIVVKEKNLIESIHFAIIEMYNENMIPSL